MYGPIVWKFLKWGVGAILLPHPVFSFNFAGEAFGKGETAFDICKKGQIKSTEEENGDVIGMQNQAYINEWMKICLQYFIRLDFMKIYFSYSQNS